MGIDLEKEVQRVKIVLDKIGFEEKVQVVLALDISGSMSYMYRTGIVQELVERLLAIGINMDANEEIDVFLFGENAHHASAAYKTNINGFVNDKIRKRFPLESSTYYSPVMKMIAKEFTPKQAAAPKSFIGKLFGKSTPAVEVNHEPVVVFFITDGANGDTSETETFIKQISDRPIFWQFVGIGNANFSFLEKLDEMGGRTVDNANFFDAGDISDISNDTLYNRILKELPSWHAEVKQKGILK